MIWWLGISIMLFAVALACTVPDPRILRASQREQLVREKVSNVDLSKRLLRNGETDGDMGASPHDKARTHKPSLLDNFYMWVAGL